MRACSYLLPIVVQKDADLLPQILKVQRHDLERANMNRASFLGSGWSRSGANNMGVVRRACPASGAQWNVQVVRGRVNGKCLWNACKALSLGLLLMVLGAAMATIGYFADHLSMAQEVRGNYTVKIRNESRGFHLNNLSYAGPIVMGVGGFIVVAACVMTFEARDSAAKVVPARLKLNSGPTSGSYCGRNSSYADHTTLRTAGSQTMATSHQYHGLHTHQHASIQHVHAHHDAERRALTHSLLQFSRGLVLDPASQQLLKKTNPTTLQQQFSVNKSPSAPNLSEERVNENGGVKETAGDDVNTVGGSGSNVGDPLKRPFVMEEKRPRHHHPGGPGGNVGNGRTQAAHSTLFRPGLQRHALSVDETAPSFRNDLQPNVGSQGSMALDLHLECPVTLRVRDRRRNPLRRQQKVEEDDRSNDNSRRSSHSCSPKLSSRSIREEATTGGSVHQLPTHSPCQHRRRSSNASDCDHRSRSRKRRCSHHPRGRLERAISSDSRLTGVIPKCHHRRNYSPCYTPQNSSELEQGESKSDTDLHHTHVVTHANVHKT